MGHLVGEYDATYSKYNHFTILRLAEHQVLKAGFS
jgi:hypothetical protein